MATIKDVARMAGVSMSTVSKYINGGSVRDANQESIQRAIAALDFRVNPFARGLKSRHSRLVGVLLPEQTAPFFHVVLMAVDKILRDRGYHTITSCYYADHGLERDCLGFLLSTGVDALLYVPENITTEEYTELTAARSVPVVQIDRMIPGIGGDAVLTENTEASYEAVLHLIRQGHRRIAILNGPGGAMTCRERLVGYLRALEENGIRYDGDLVVSGSLSFATGYHGLLDLMDTETPPTAIFSTNYDITMGAITAARERGIRIPEDIGVVGYDCVDVCGMMMPPLPVVYQPEAEIGRTAAAYLLQRLDGSDEPPQVTRLPCQLMLGSAGSKGSRS